MKYQLTAHEARVIGCLLEKQVTTPEQYPLSVNAVVTACNQKTNREPVMSLSEGEVQTLLDTLVKRHYLRTVSGFGNRVTKYEQRFCNSEFGDLKLSAGEVAVVTTLLAVLRALYLIVEKSIRRLCRTLLFIMTLATSLPAAKKQYLMAEAVGHYGIFNGRKWRDEIAPVVEAWIRGNGG